MNQKLIECIEVIDEIRTLVEAYKQLEEQNNINDYQKGFLDGYNHMKAVINLIDVVEEIVKAD